MKMPQARADTTEFDSGLQIHSLRGKVRSVLDTGRKNIAWRTTLEASIPKWPHGGIY